ncbi:unnamed protein product [Aphis gossypii]|uniref:Uncharacterized protein n=1 Tax=Aphis gossypii TaxID=80765 RepID=A0A9P0IJR5_APHGO|nr:unnamed protein product [Aphis gossypii]
MRPEGSLRVSL